MTNFQADRGIEDCWLELGLQMCLNFGNIHSNAVADVWVMKKKNILKR